MEVFVGTPVGKSGCEPRGVRHEILSNLDREITVALLRITTKTGTMRAQARDKTREQQIVAGAAAQQLVGREASKPAEVTESSNLIPGTFSPISLYSASSFFLSCTLPRSTGTPPSGHGVA